MERTPTTMAEFAALLNDTRRQKGLSIRAAAVVAGVPAATAQGWLSGRHLPTPALREHFLMLVEELGLSDSFSDQLWAANDGRGGRSPYLGLRPYSVAESELFFGRSQAMASLVAAIEAAEPGLPVVLVGASGSGKSSLLAAGLLGQVGRAGVLPGWSGLSLSVGELCSDGELPTLGSQTIVVIDQFEDVFFWRAAGSRIFAAC